METEDIQLNNKTCILITGMHRSGTSLLGNLFYKMGLPIGNDIMRPSFDNPFGFFENNKVVNLNDVILKELNASWDQPFFQSSDLSDEIIKETFSSSIQQIIKNEFKDNDLFFIKDPRISILMPLWIEALNKNGIKVAVIICNRNPHHVSKSLKFRNGFEDKKSHLLYSIYSLEAEKYTRNENRLILSDITDINNFDINDDLLSSFLSKLTGFSQFTYSSISTAYSQKKQHSEIETSYTNHITTVSTEIYALLNSLKNNDQSVRKQLDKIYLETTNYREMIIDTFKENFKGKIVLNDKSDATQLEVIDFDVSSGFNLVSLEPRLNLNTDLIKIFPINHSCSFQFHKCIINNAEVVWKNTNGSFIEDRFYFIDPFPCFIIEYDQPIESISISFTIEHVEEKIEDIINSILLTQQLTELESKFQTERNTSSKTIRNLRDQIELLTILSETEKKEDYITYQRSLRELNESHEKTKDTFNQKILKLTESYQKSTQEYAGEISRLRDEMKSTNENYKNEILKSKEYYENLLLEYHTKMEEQKKRTNQYHQQIETINKELDRLKTDNEYHTDQLTRRIESLDKKGKETSNTLDRAYLTIESQHNEIQKFKVDYSDRERELNQVQSSLSYKIGRVITWLPRMLFDSLQVLGASFQVIPTITKLAISKPKNLLGAINFDNIKTLFKALRSEPPFEIIRNARKKLDFEFQINRSIPQVNSANVSKRKKILCVFPNLPDYDQSSGGKRAVRFLEILCEDHEIIVFTLGARQEKYINKLESIGTTIVNSDHRKEIYKLHKHFDTIIFSWYYTLHDNGELLSKYPNAQIIVDTVDVHWVREKRSIGTVEGLTEENVLQNKEVEIASYRHADIIWVVSPEDKAAVLRELPDACPVIVSNIHEIEKSVYVDPGTNNMLFFGGFNHPPNIRAAEILVKDILPPIRERTPSAKVVLAGANAPDEIVGLGNLEGVEYLGYIPENKILDLYRNSLIAVAPLIAGAGIKGKLCEAIAYHVPVMTTDIGNEGIGLIDGKEGFICDPKDMAEQLVPILNRKFDLSQISSRAQRKLISIVGKDIAKMRMSQSLFPEVSICIVTWNKLELLKNCIESLLSNTLYPFFKILIHSNGCTDGTQEYLSQSASADERIVPILSSKNDVFVIPNNNMMKMFPHNDVVLLNNDTKVTRGWLNGLRDVAYESTNHGIVGSKILYPDGTLQEFGSELYTNGTGKNIGKGDDPDKPEYLNQRYVGYVSGCSMYIKRSTIDKLGYLDELFHPCYCEDSDYAYRGWRNDIKTVVTPKSVVYHLEGGTSGKNENEGFKKYQTTNFEKFLVKHKDHLKNIHDQIDNYNREA